MANGRLDWWKCDFGGWCALSERTCALGGLLSAEGLRRGHAHLLMRPYQWFAFVVWLRFALSERTYAFGGALSVTPSRPSTVSNAMPGPPRSLLFPRHIPLITSLPLTPVLSLLLLPSLLSYLLRLSSLSCLSRSHLSCLFCLSRLSFFSFLSHRSYFSCFLHRYSRAFRAQKPLSHSRNE